MMHCGINLFKWSFGKRIIWVFFTVYKVSKYCVNVYMFIFMSRHVCRAGVAAGLTSSYR